MGSVFHLIFSALLCTFFSPQVYAQEYLLPLKSAEFTTAIDPDASTPFWKNAPVAPLFTSATEVEISKISKGEYLSPINGAPSDFFKFTIKPTPPHSELKTVTVTLGKNAHNILLKRALLQKLGYQLPAISYLPKIEISFHDRHEKKLFLSNLEKRTSADTDRWVVNDDKDSITLQDVVISNEQEGETNLASDSIKSKMIDGNRLLSSLIIPYALTFIPESVNLFSWVSGTIYGDGVKVDYPDSDEFNPSFDDIHWMIRKIAVLTPSDWKEIADAAHFPEEVKLLVLEKLISRRNSFLELFSISEPELTIQSNITLEPNLIKGQITKKEWEGYATHFSLGTPDSPLNPGERFAFTKTNLFSSILANAVKQLNELPFFHTDPKGKLERHFENLGKNGGTKSVPLGAWGFPFASGELIFSRAVITGNFLGTDNLLQLADQFGIRLSLGAQLSTEGLPFAIGTDMKAAVSVSRTYSHLRPLRSIKKGTHYGFQNIVIPYFLRSSAHQLNPIFEDGFDVLPNDEKLKIYTEALQNFKNKIAPGESIIITDSLVGDEKISGNINLYKLVDLTLAAQASELVINRLHIFRKDEQTFQVYKDFGEAFQPSFGVQLGIRKPIPEGSGSFLVRDKDTINAATMPIIRAKWGKNNGLSKVRYFSINFDPKNNQDLDESIAQLRIIQQTLLHGNTETLRKHVKPYLLETHFKEKNMQDRFMFFSQRKLRSSSDLTISYPEGRKRTFTRDFFGKNNGFDYKNTLSNILSFANEYLTHSKVVFAEDSVLNPGYTTNGFAKNLLLEFEAEKMQDGSFKNPFVKLSHVFNGWKTSKKRALKILERFSREYGDHLFSSTVLNETEQLFLYNISLNILLYDQAIQHLENLTEENIQSLFTKYGIKLDHRRIDDRIVKRIQEFKKNHSSKSLLKAISIADRLLPAEGLIEFLGGKKNIFIYAKLDGFRKGDENGNSPIYSNTIGIIGSKNSMGPLFETRKEIGMTENEFLPTWIMGRIL